MDERMVREKDDWGHCARKFPKYGYRSAIPTPRSRLINDGNGVVYNSGFSLYRNLTFMSKQPVSSQGINPTLSRSDAMQMFRQATQLSQTGKYDEALSLARRLPGSPTRSRMMVDILLASGTDRHLKKAEREASEWLRRQPGHPEPVQKLIEIQLTRHEFARALRSCNELERRLPGKGVADYFRAVAQQLQGNPKAAMRHYQKFVKAENMPEDDGSKTAAVAQTVRAAMLLCATSSGQFPGSKESDKSLLLSKPGETRLLKNSLVAWEQSGVEEKREAPEWEKLQAAEAWYKLGGTIMWAYSGAADTLVCLDHAIRLNPEHANARIFRPFTLNYLCGTDDAEIMAEHKALGAWLESRHGRAVSPEQRVHGKSPEVESDRIRIGYLSSDFCTHSVAYFIAPVISQHDREQFAVHLFYTGTRNDHLTERFRSEAEFFHPVSGMNDQQLHQFIEQQEIDILVDLNGITTNNRLPVLAARAAAIQVSWLGYPNTSGLTTMDYRIVDATTDPIEYAHTLATEKLIHMPATFSIYDPLDAPPPVSELPCLENGMVTFGCFNTLSKINDELVGAWSGILQKVPRSRLLLKNNSLSYSNQRHRVTEAFQAMGIDSDRLSLMGKVQGREEHLACYNQVDISLDCYPYNGTTTNCESLLMGVPVVTLVGIGHRSRVTASQLHALGLERLIADDWDEYVRIAVNLASDNQGLRQIRKNLRNTLLTSPLCDAATFTRELEQKYREMIEAKRTTSVGGPAT